MEAAGVTKCFLASLAGAIIAVCVLALVVNYPSSFGAVVGALSTILAGGVAWLGVQGQIKKTQELTISERMFEAERLLDDLRFILEKTDWYIRNMSGFRDRYVKVKRDYSETGNASLADLLAASINTLDPFPVAETDVRFSARMREKLRRCNYRTLQVCNAYAVNRFGNRTSFWGREYDPNDPVLLRNLEKLDAAARDSIAAFRELFEVAKGEERRTASYLERMSE